MKPRIPEVPSHLDPTTRRFLQSVRDSVLDLHAVMPPTPPSNLGVTPVAFGNIIKFTRAADAERHIVLWNTSPSLDGAASVDVGLSAEWSHEVGKDGVQRFYWVKSLTDGKESQIVGPVAGTTLAAAAALASPLTPTPPEQSNVMVFDGTTHHVIPNLEQQ